MICVKSALLPHLCGKPLPAEFERPNWRGICLTFSEMDSGEPYAGRAGDDSLAVADHILLEWIAANCIASRECQGNLMEMPLADKLAAATPR
jgi:hypothetical protein